MNGLAPFSSFLSVTTDPKKIKSIWRQLPKSRAVLNRTGLTVPADSLAPFMWLLMGLGPILPAMQVAVL